MRSGEGKRMPQYFKEEVRRFLVERFGWERVYQGGLKVYTTVDLDMQKAAEAEVARGIAEIEKRQRRKNEDESNPLQARWLLWTRRPAKSARWSAAVTSRRATSTAPPRPSGSRAQRSSPSVRSRARAGFTPGTIIANLDDPIMTLQGAWGPEDEHSEGSSMTMRAALKTSSNRAAVRMLEDVGIPVTVDYAKRLGVGSVPSVARTWIRRGHAHP